MKLLRAEESYDEILLDVKMPLTMSPGLKNEMEYSSSHSVSLVDLEIGRSKTTIVPFNTGVLVDRNNPIKKAPMKNQRSRTGWSGL